MVMFLAPSQLTNSQTLSQNSSCLGHGSTKRDIHLENNLILLIFFAFQCRTEGTH